MTAQIATFTDPGGINGEPRHTRAHRPLLHLQHRRATPTNSGMLRPIVCRRLRETLRTWLQSDTKHVAAQHLFISTNTSRKHIERIRENYAVVGPPATTKTALLFRALTMDGSMSANSDFAGVVHRDPSAGRTMPDQDRR